MSAANTNPVGLRDAVLSSSRVPPTRDASASLASPEGEAEGDLIQLDARYMPPALHLAATRAMMGS